MQPLNIQSGSGKHYGSLAMKVEDKETKGKKRPKKMMLVAAMMIGVALVMLVTQSTWSSEMGVDKKEDVTFALNKGTMLDPVPGINVMAQGYNVLRGMGLVLDPQVVRDIGRFTYSAGQRVSIGTLSANVPDQVSVIQEPACRTLSLEDTFAHTASVQAILKEGWGFTAGFMEEVRLSAEIEEGPETVELETTLSAGLMFGLSSSFKGSMKMSQEGYSYSATHSEASEVFVATMNWKKAGSETFAFSDAFVKGIAEIGRISPRNTFALNVAVMKFFDQFGTHVLTSAAFGAYCRQNLMINTGGHEFSMRESESLTGSLEAKFFGFEANGEFSTAAVLKQQSTSFGSFSFGNVACDGYVEINVCNSKRTSDVTAPVMIQFEPTWIWNVDAPGLDDAVRYRFIGVYRQLVIAARLCSIRVCGGRGVCVLGPQLWTSLASGQWYGRFSTRDFEPMCIPKPPPRPRSTTTTPPLIPKTSGSPSYPPIRTTGGGGPPVTSMGGPGGATTRRGTTRRGTGRRTTRRPANTGGPGPATTSATTSATGSATSPATTVGGRGGTTRSATGSGGPPLTTMSGPGAATTSATRSATTSPLTTMGGSGGTTGSGAPPLTTMSGSGGATTRRGTRRGTRSGSGPGRRTTGSGAPPVTTNAGPGPATTSATGSATSPLTTMGGSNGVTGSGAPPGTTMSGAPGNTRSGTGSGSSPLTTVGGSGGTTGSGSGSGSTTVGP